MKTGLISDTHGNLGRTRQAIEVFDREEGVAPVCDTRDSPWDEKKERKNV
jgi:hypothetical protein